MVFVGCSKKQFKAEPKSFKGKKLEYEQLLAQHNEIPDTHVGFEVESIIQNPHDNRSLEIIYRPIKKVSVTMQQIKDSYVADMEMLGWQNIAEFDSETTMQLIFQKAGRTLLSTVEVLSNLQIKMIVYSKK